MTIIEQGLFTLDLIDSSDFPATPSECSKQPDEAMIIDVDAFEYEDILKQPKMWHHARDTQ